MRRRRSLKVKTKLVKFPGVKIALICLLIIVLFSVVRQAPAVVSFNFNDCAMQSTSNHKQKYKVEIKKDGTVATFSNDQVNFRLYSAKTNNGCAFILPPSGKFKTCHWVSISKPKILTGRYGKHEYVATFFQKTYANYDDQKQQCAGEQKDARKMTLPILDYKDNMLKVGVCYLINKHQQSSFIILDFDYYSVMWIKDKAICI